MRILLTLISLITPYLVCAISFSDFLCDSTLRVDYIFGGYVDENNVPHLNIYTDGLTVSPGWAGRRHNLKDVPLRGNGQIIMRDIETEDTLYRNSFSTLFQEWLNDNASNSTPTAFQNLFLLPMPKRPAKVTVNLFDNHGQSIASLTHKIDPTDILIKKLSQKTPVSHKYILKSGDPKEKIDVAILAEGYTIEEMDSFYYHADCAVKSIASHEPFKSMIDCFNFVAVASPSTDSGVSVPRLDDWKSTAVNSHFSTFYSDRYLTTPDIKSIHDCLSSIPYEHIIILANTDEYGGGGIFNLYTLTTARHEYFSPVVVHEFGHSFGGLADEYFYDDDPLATSTYPVEVEPWEPNITTLTDFSKKWENLLKKSTPIPTPIEEKDLFPIGVYEGGGYVSKGVYRPADECRMRNNTYPSFCPACIEWLSRIINFYLPVQSASADQK